MAHEPASLKDLCESCGMKAGLTSYYLRIFKELGVIKPLENHRYEITPEYRPIIIDIIKHKMAEK